MAEVRLLQRRFRRMVRDFPRDDLPKDTAWNIVDYIPDLGAPLRKRGGYSYASADIAATSLSATHIIGGIYAPYEEANKLLAIDEDGVIVQVTSASATSAIGTAVTVLQNPVMHRDIVVIPASGGATNPKSLKFASSAYTLADLAGSPPQAKYATVYKDRTVLAGTTAEPQRTWFSDPGDPEGWDTTNTYWDISFPVTGLASLRNALLIFSSGHTSRLRGSTPPPGSDMIADDPLFAVGCTDARSIAAWGDNVVFASPEGIYLTDGVAYDDITKQAGMLTYWQELLTSYSTAYTIVGGVIRDDYWFCVLNDSSFVDAGMINLPGRAWVRHSNIDARSMWTRQGASDELYFGRRGAARVASVSSCYMPTASVKNDADGDAVAPVLETAFYTDGLEKKRWRRVYFSHDTRDGATDNPVLTVGYITSPEATSYTDVATLAGSAHTLSETTEYTRVRRFLNKAAYGMAFKIAQSNASSDTRGYVIAAELHGREKSRV